MDGINHVDLYISAIYPSELELKDTSTSSTEVCYLDTNRDFKIWDATTSRTRWLIKDWN